MLKTNQDIRRAVKNAGFNLWQMADKLNMNGGNFSRKLRKELPAAEKEQILKIINELKERNKMQNINQDIKKAVKEANLFLYQIADKLNMNDGNFSRILRKELSDAKKEQILKIIKELKEGE